MKTISTRVRTVAAALACLSLVGAQQPAPTAKFSVTSQLVIVNVSVRDRGGNPIQGLSAKDFTVLEDDKPQKVSVFEYQQLETEPAAPSLKPKTPTAEPVRKPQITPSSPGQV